MSAFWLAQPLVSYAGTVLAAGLDPAALTDGDVPEIYIRMQAIFDATEFERCEGRLMSLDIFEPLDTLTDEVIRWWPRLADWLAFIGAFGDYYGLGAGPITLDPAYLSGARAEFARRKA